MINGLMESKSSPIYQEFKANDNGTVVVCGFGFSSSSSSHGDEFLCTESSTSVMFPDELLHVLGHVSLVLFIFNLVLLLLLKIFGWLCGNRAAVTDRLDASNKTETAKTSKKKYVHWADESTTIHEQIHTNNNNNNAIIEEQEQGGILYWLSEAPFSKHSLLGYEGRDQDPEYSEEVKEIPCLHLENSSFAAAESLCKIKMFPLQNHHGTESTDADQYCHSVPKNLEPLDADPCSVLLTPQSVVMDELQAGNSSNPEYNHPQIEPENISEYAKESIHATRIHIESEHAIMNQEKEEENSSILFCGESSTRTGESTSKSSVEWRSSMITKDSETEYPFSSSSRKSSSRWESYAFRKYDEEMLYFHRISAEKLTETESFRSLVYQPRSMSQRIYHKLTTKHVRTPDEIRNPYRELEHAYVAQVCLAWECLNWNYTDFFRKNPDPKAMGRAFCPARVAQEFQQFQVLLQRFVENEPYECGRRPEVYAKMKVHSPKLLLVPDITEADGEQEVLISAIEFLLILKDIIRTFLNFVSADKQTRSEQFRSIIKKKSANGDQNIVNFLKKANHKKKMRVKDLIRRRCFIQRKLLKVEDEMEIMMGLIDLKVVSRVLRMPNVTEEQLHWCEQKMLKVRVLDGRIQRDSSPLAFPVH